MERTTSQTSMNISDVTPPEDQFSFHNETLTDRAVQLRTLWEIQSLMVSLSLEVSLNRIDLRSLDHCLAQIQIRLSYLMYRYPMPHQHLERLKHLERSLRLRLDLKRAHAQ
jgi:hypothetical protein